MMIKVHLFIGMYWKYAPITKAITSQMYKES
jgi:hypothetical protein